MTGMLSETRSIHDFAPLEFIPSAVRLTMYDSGAARWEAGSLQQFLRDVAEGRINLKISRVFGLDQLADDHRLLDQNAAAGK